MEGIITSHIFIKAKYSALLHSWMLPGWWPQLLGICCKTIWLPGCSPLPRHCGWTAAHGIVEPLR